MDTMVIDVNAVTFGVIKMEKINLLYEENQNYSIEEIKKSKVVEVLDEKYWETLLEMNAALIFDELNFDGSPNWGKISELASHCHNSDPVPDVRPIRLVNEDELIRVRKQCESYNKSYSDFLKKKSKLRRGIEHP